MENGILDEKKYLDQSNYVNKNKSYHTLQLLTFMFWGLTVLVISGLTFCVFLRLTSGTKTDLVYFFLASLVLFLPASIVCDHKYSKKVVLDKEGASTKIRLVFSIVFASFGLLAFIAVVLGIVLWLLNGTIKPIYLALVLSGVAAFIYYLATFTRVHNSLHASWFNTAYKYLVLVVFTVLVTLVFTNLSFSNNYLQNCPDNSCTAQCPHGNEPTPQCCGGYPYDCNVIDKVNSSN